MNIIVERAWKKDTYTIGKLIIDGKRICETIEDKDRGLTDNMSVDEIKNKKVYGETAIPAGTYTISMTVISPKFKSRAWAKEYGGIVPRILNVKGFDGVLLHPMNTAKDSYGCIGMGRNTAVGKVTNSTYWFYYIMDNYLIPAKNRKEVIQLTIK